MRKHAILAIAAATLLLGSLASPAQAQWRLRGRAGTYGYGYAPAYVYPNYGPSYGGFSYGPNMMFSSTYDSYPGLPPVYPSYAIAPVRYHPPSLPLPATIEAQPTTNPYTANAPDVIAPSATPPAGTSLPR